MRLAFSTLGCPGRPLPEVLGLAHDAGATAMELRLAPGELVYPAMPAGERAQVRAACAAAGVQLLTLASYVQVCAPGPAAGTPDPVARELQDTLELAADLGARYVRLFPGAGLPPHVPGTPLGPELAAAERRGVARLAAAVGPAASVGVTLALETHDSHPRASDLLRLLTGIPGGEAVRVIWDVLHPWRHEEPPARTAALLADRLAYTQYKDGVRDETPHGVRLTLPGAGAVPLREVRALSLAVAAQQHAPEPWVVLEWERAWHPELPPLAAALTALTTALA